MISKIVTAYKDKYELIQNPLYLQNLLSFQNTEYYLKTSTPDKYKKFLSELSIDKASLRNALKAHLDLITSKTVCVSTTSGLPLYLYTDDKVVICIPEVATRDQVKIILGSVFFLRVGQLKKKSFAKFIGALSVIYARALVRSTTRAIDTDEIYPQIVKILIAWFLKYLGLINNQSMLIGIASSVSIPFSDSKEVNDVFSAIANISTVNDLLSYISTLIKTDVNQIKVSLTMKQCIDFTLGIEDVAHGVFIVPMAYYLLFPTNMYYTVKPLSRNEYVISFIREIGILFSNT